MECVHPRTGSERVRSLRREISRRNPYTYEVTGDSVRGDRESGPASQQGSTPRPRNRSNERQEDGASQEVDGGSCGRRNALPRWCHRRSPRVGWGSALERRDEAFDTHRITCSQVQARDVRVVQRRQRVRDDHCGEAQHLHQHDRVRHWHVGPVQHQCGSLHHGWRRCIWRLRLRWKSQRDRNRSLEPNKPGNWVCPDDTSGTFYIGPVPAGPSATQAHGGSFERSGALPGTAGPIILGTYNWVVDGSYSGNITFAGDDTYTSTLSTDDSGGWVQGGKSVALTINGGTDGGGGCLFVGKSNRAGTAIGTTSTPGNWVCPGYATKGTFVIS